LKAHYKSLYDKHGISHNAVQTSSDKSQLARYSNLVKNIPNDESILDIGCGFGGITSYLFDDKNHNAEYHGIDFVEEFILNGINSDNPLISYEVIDAAKESYPKGYDWCIASGIFNNAMEDNWAFLKKVISEMMNAANKGIAFNLLSTYVDYQSEGLYYFNPLEVLDFLKKNVSPLVLLDHSYRVKEGVIPYEFTIQVFK
jgi:cyclopropane fatty-acyl-phospholipid synthase-like methyltransferase